MTSNSARILGVYLVNAEQPLRVGTLLRDPDGNVKFIIDEGYVDLGPERPTLSLRWSYPGDDERAIRSLRAADDKIARQGELPAWFGHLLPEGVLRELIVASFGWKQPEDFDLLVRLGEDLPGALIVRDEGEIRSRFALSGARERTESTQVFKFSLGGLQLKFSMIRADHHLMLPARGRLGNMLVKFASERYSDLPEMEFLGMKLAQAAGVNVAPCELVPIEQVGGVPERLLVGEYVLAVERFDRLPGGGRVHFEEFAQILGVTGIRKYTAANEESNFRMIQRFAADSRGAVQEAVRRFTVNVLLGNGDAHLKNWAFRYPDGRTPELSPAYDIVPTIALNPGDINLALKFRGTSDYRLVTLDRFEATARLLQVESKILVREVQETVERAVDLWPAVIADLPVAEKRLGLLRQHWEGLALTRDLENAFRSVAVSLQP
jgi:serine/threonine-protein kinase HipA